VEAASFPGYLAAMRILLWHGYLLTGSGSNVYTANLAREWRSAGHDVVVMCQGRNSTELGFVDEEFEVDADSAVLPARPSTCRVARPAIGSILPVYVFDEYEGFTAKLFVDLTDEELERYTDLNVDAMAAVISSFQPEAIVTGHEVMGPEIARRACGRTGSTYIAKLHGSALEYAVKMQERYRDHAVSGLGSAQRVVGGSAYMVREAASVIPGWSDRAAVVNPGCDVELFQPDPGTRRDRPTIMFVGKLIRSKGVHDLLAALGFLSTEGVDVVVVGYGGFEDGLRDLAGKLSAGDIEGVSALARAAPDGPLDSVLGLIEAGAMDDGYIERYAAANVDFTGRLEHGPLSRVLPTADVLVVPSIVAEAFGMVAAEAAACGVLPIVPDHSGIAEAGAAVEEAIGRPGLLTFDPGDPIRSMAAAIDRVLSIPREERERMGAVAVRLARSRWSWAHVARELLDLATQH
jgi:glycosyltransferase involved in cell wall biosynthesis